MIKRHIKSIRPKREDVIKAFTTLSSFCQTTLCHQCPIQVICDNYLDTSTALIQFTEECKDELNTCVYEDGEDKE